MQTTTPALHAALIDWIVAHGSPIGVFGPRNPLSPSTHTDRTDLATYGIDYNTSTLGDLGGEEWCQNTYDETTTHPGLWADVTCHRKAHTARWFVPGAPHTLSDIILDVLTATDPQ